MMNKIRLQKTVVIFIFLSSIVLFINGCDRGNKERLAIEVTWDRDVCLECRMALSDNRYAAQIVDEDGKNYLFDDAGCAVLWLRKQDWRDNGRVWVSDVNTSKWIEADKANWIFGDTHTPMGYGFAATISTVEKPMNFETVKKWIYAGKTLANQNSVKHVGMGHMQSMKEATNDQLPMFKKKK